ncbi:unnamed protein product [Caenorhabditis auriculariae]|uniref:Transmembrane protein n=1 Tax=Caenorhabditis auriculariae TaxID=2777116 RepID=A0A8S1HMD7_9PELO|nr:unnamed protein product [Caenorhabditis auriculariae]
MQSNYHYGLDNPFANIIQEEKSHRFFKLHIQTWVYIHSAVSMVTSLMGITVGILFLVSPDWHEKFYLYKQTLAYLRRADPLRYWLFYKIFFFAWIFVHLLHLASIIVTVVAVQKTSTALLKPQLLVLILLIGLLILGLSGLIVISVTGSRPTWLSIVIVLFFFVVGGTNLSLVVIYHKFLDDKMAALRELLGNGKSVHFKDSSS